MHWMTLPLRRYADFSGRSRRKEYWMFHLFNLLVAAAIWTLIGIVMLAMYNADASEDVMMTIFVPLAALHFFFALFLIVPGLAVTVRRLHDQDKSGWAILVALIPGIGGLVLLVFMILEGTRGPNRFGPDPLESSGAMPAA